MGLLDSLFGGPRMADPVRGTAQVVSTTGNDGEAIWQNARIHLVVQADGVPPTAVQLHTLAPTAKWPWPGHQLPVIVDRANPQKVKIVWDEVERSSDRAARHAAAMAEQMRATHAPAPAPPPAQPQPQPPPQQQDDMVDELTRLAALHKSGALTDEEFAAAKKRVLEGT